jgi:hypothetical protein
MSVRPLTPKKKIGRNSAVVDLSMTWNALAALSQARLLNGCLGVCAHFAIGPVIAA